MLRILFRILANGLAIMITAALLPGIEVHYRLGTILVLGLVFGLVNGVIRPIVQLLALPVTLATLGLFQFVIDALLLLLIGHIVPGLTIDGFWPAFFGAIILGMVSTILEWLLDQVFPEQQTQKARA